MKKLKQFLKDNNILKTEKIVVACSGGPDSMFLLYALNELGYQVICAHVNHNIRTVSESEYEFVENYCNIHNIIFEGMIIEKYNKDNFHNEARTIRYNFFKEVVKKHNAAYLTTAHHGDDLVETILMRLSRGSNISGYKGFSNFEKIENYTLIRPLIKYPKEEIKNKCKIYNIDYVLDLSNDSNKYTRNRYRHTVLDFLKQENKNVHEKYYEFSNELNEIVNYITTIANSKLPYIYQNNFINITEFNKEDKVVKKALLEIILSNIYKNDINKINKTHINSIIDLIENTKPQIEINLPNNIKVRKAYNKVSFTKDKALEEKYEFILKDKIVLPNNNTLEILDNDIEDNSNYTIRLNSELIKLPLHVRTKKDGDKIVVKNMQHLKKVKEIFIENKIENEKRKTWPIVLDNTGQIIWIPGLKKSNLDVKKHDKYDIIIKYNLKERENEQ